MKFECKRCGKCCLELPCIFAQTKYYIRKGSLCPDLAKTENGYVCELIQDFPEAIPILMDGYCDQISQRHLKPSINIKEITKEYFPDAPDDEIEHIIWAETCFPDFWRRPKDGWTIEECLRKNLSDYKKKIDECLENKGEK